ncbi:MAG TPA: hypothetical protein VLA66_05325 [Thermoanaerobaculia bacterium]|nr:hypothetical protein [Thermoanaerobaculia bacterium]
MTASSSRRRRLSALLLGALLGGPALAEVSARLALLPLENLSGLEEAAQVVGPRLAEALARRGWRPIPGEEVERILREERARRGDTLSDRARERLLVELDAGGVAAVAILVWLPGRNPIVSLSARILGPEGAEAGAVGSVSAAELERPFGLGPPIEIEELADRAIERLARALPAPGESGRPAERRHAPVGGRDPVVLRSPGVFDDGPLRICLLPFGNDARDRGAPRILAEVLARRLRASGRFEPVEPAELRAALRAERVPSLRFLDATALRAVAARLGTPYFLRGTIWQWVEGSPASSGPVPEVELELELVDVERGRTVWAAHHGRRGDDYVGLFLRGRIGTVAGLLDQVVAEILAASQRADPVRPQPLSSEIRP